MDSDSPIVNSEGKIVIRVGNLEIDYERQSKNLFRSLARHFPQDPTSLPPWNRLWLNPDSHADFFNLQGRRREDLPYFREAEQSAEQSRKVLYTRTDGRKSRTKVGSGKTVPRDSFLAQLSQAGQALTKDDNIALVNDAAAHGDEEFFVKLAAVIKARWKRNAPNLLRLQMAHCWTKCLLWLMTDQTATIFLRDHVRFETPGAASVTMTAYSRAKLDLGLVQHPHPPITGIAPSGKLFGSDKKEFLFVDVK